MSKYGKAGEPATRVGLIFSEIHQLADASQRLATMLIGGVEDADAVHLQVALQAVGRQIALLGELGAEVSGGWQPSHGQVDRNCVERILMPPVYWAEGLTS